MTQKLILLLVVVVVYTIQSGASQAAFGCQQNATYFQNVDLFDGENSSKATNVLVVDGKIHSIGKNVKPLAGALVVGGTGRTLLPGMIDCHVHVFFDTQLAQAAMFGVTTELDMMSVPRVAANFRSQQSGGLADDRADMLSAGAAVTVKSGHGTQFGFPVPTLDSADDAAAFIAARIEEGSDYIKLIHEDGSAYGATRKTLSDEMVKNAIAAAKSHPKLIVAHVGAKHSAELVIEHGIDGLAHLFADEKIDPELIAMAKAKGIFVTPTAVVVSNASGANMTDDIITNENIASLLTRENIVNLRTEFPTRPGAKNSWEILKFNIESLHQAGVPILAGTDAPNPGTVHGASMHLELQLLVKCGLSPTQALASATSLPAKFYGMDDRGKIEVGKRADLWLVDGDPTATISDSTRIVSVWKNGNLIDRSERMKLVAAEKKAEAEKTKTVKSSESKTISDFEDGEPSASFGAGWAKSTDTIMGGSSTVEFEVQEGGANESKSGLAVNGRVRQEQPAFSGIMFSPGKTQMQAGDVSAHDAISFWAKSDQESTFQVMFFTQARGFQPSTQAFKANNQWKQFRFGFEEFSGTDGSDVTGIWFGTNTAGEFGFSLDEVKLEPAIK